MIAPYGWVFLAAVAWWPATIYSIAGVAGLAILVISIRDICLHVAMYRRAKRNAIASQVAGGPAMNLSPPMPGRFYCPKCGSQEQHASVCMNCHHIFTPGGANGGRLC